MPEGWKKLLMYRTQGVCKEAQWKQTCWLYISELRVYWLDDLRNYSFLGGAFIWKKLPFMYNKEVHPGATWQPTTLKKTSALPELRQGLRTPASTAAFHWRALYTMNSSSQAHTLNSRGHIVLGTRETTLLNKTSEVCQVFPTQIETHYRTWRLTNCQNLWPFRLKEQRGNINEDQNTQPTKKNTGIDS